MNNVEKEIERISEIRFTPKSDVNAYLHTIEYDTLKDGISATELLRRPKVKLNELKKKELPELDDEFAKDVSEFDTLKQLKENIKEILKCLNFFQSDCNNQLLFFNSGRNLCSLFSG